MVLRVDLTRGSVSDYLQELTEAGLAGTALGWARAAVQLEQPVPVNELPGFAAGRVSVQDAGAQLAATLLELQPGMRVLDACAAPGGKTGHMLEQQPGLARAGCRRHRWRRVCSASAAISTGSARMRSCVLRISVTRNSSGMALHSSASWWTPRARRPASSAAIPTSSCCAAPTDIAAFARTQRTILQSAFRPARDAGPTALLHLFAAAG